MTIIEAIAQIDELKPNTISQTQKVKWLSKLDGMVKRLIVDTHEGGDAIPFYGYTEDTPVDTELIVPAPFESMYIHWLEAQIDYAHGEYGKYNNSIQVYHNEWEAYRNYYNRNNMPIGKKVAYFGAEKKPDTRNKLFIDVGVDTEFSVDCSEFDFTDVEMLVFTIKNSTSVTAPVIVERQLTEPIAYNVIVTAEESLLIKPGAQYDIDKVMTDGRRYKTEENGLVMLNRGVGDRID